MATANTSFRGAPRHSQRGLTLVEFMVSITIGLLLVAAVATLIASQSSNRAEVDRAGRLIENGRYGIRALADDLQQQRLVVDTREAAHLADFRRDAMQRQ